MNKNDIRIDILKKRRALSIDEVAKKSKVILEQIKELDITSLGQVVFIYHSFENEVDTKGIIEYLVAIGKKVCVPYIINNTEIEAREVYATCTYVTNSFGIQEPDETKKVDKNLIGTIILPGIAFDLELNRIGFGKGYYDNYLNRQDIRKIAIAYDFQVLDKIPSEPHDVKMDMIITDKRVIF